MKQNDNNAKAMADALLPHLEEKLKRDILPALFEEQIGGLKRNAERMLDQLKDQKRASQPNGSQEAVILTREEARDPKIYRAAKAKAQAMGTTVQIVSVEETSDAP